MLLNNSLLVKLKNMVCNLYFDVDFCGFENAYSGLHRGTKQNHCLEEKTCNTFCIRVKKTKQKKTNILKTRTSERLT